MQLVLKDGGLAKNEENKKNNVKLPMNLDPKLVKACEGISQVKED